MKAPASPRGTKPQILEAVDRQVRKACPWQRTGGVVDHQVVDLFVRDASLGKGLGAGDAEGARGGASFVAPAKAGAQGQRFEPCSTGFSLSRE
jgi:hypothetical protein